MPVFLNGASNQNKPKPSASLTKFYPLLTGRPTSSIGWFSSTTPTLKEKINNMRRIIDGLTITNKGDAPVFSYDDIDLNDVNDLIELTDQDQFLLAKNIPISTTIAYADAYFLGFQKMTTTINYKQTSLLVPIIQFVFYYSDGSFAKKILLDADELDPNTLTSLHYTYIDEAMEGITMQTIYDKATAYYFNTDMRTLLDQMPVIAAKNKKSDKDILRAYGHLKYMQAAQTFNPAQLSAFVHALTLHSANKAFLSQLLLQYPELTFASLSEQFELAAQTFPSL